jgi:ABC-type sugar transport system substrate-binding protein
MSYSSNAPSKDRVAIVTGASGGIGRETSKALRVVMTDLLTAFPKIDAVFAINDPAAIGSDLAARQAQRHDCFVVGVDGSPDAVSALKEPGTWSSQTRESWLHPSGIPVTV